MHTPDQSAHRAFLNELYGPSRWLYDASRRPYLWGRDVALNLLLADPWDSLVEVGPGTGRNLAILSRRRPGARLGGVEPCDRMREYARRRVDGVRWVDGFAEDADVVGAMGAPVDRILFSYSLSMVQQPELAVARALSQVRPGGEVLVVDYGDLSGMPRPAGDWLRGWLARFRVRPLDASLFDGRAAELRWGAGRYWVLARMVRPIAG